VSLGAAGLRLDRGAFYWAGEYPIVPTVLEGYRIYYPKLPRDLEALFMPVLAIAVIYCVYIIEGAWEKMTQKLIPQSGCAPMRD